MACEKIKNTTRRKTEPFIQKVVVKKCEAREKKAYAPYRCKLTEKNKCVTPNIKMFDNALFSASAKKSKSASITKKKPASPSPLSTASTVKSTKSAKKPVKVIYNELYDKKSSSSKSKKSTVASPSPLSTASSTKSSVASTGPKKVKSYTVKFYDNPAFSASPKKESVKMRNNPLYSK